MHTRVSCRLSRDHPCRPQTQKIPPPLRSLRPAVLLPPGPPQAGLLGLLSVVFLKIITEVLYFHHSKCTYVRDVHFIFKFSFFC